MAQATPPTPPFVSHCLDLLQPIGAMRAKRMFGGWGLYAEDVFIAVIADDRLYLKVDSESRPAFEAAGSEPFVYEAKTQAVAMSYWSAPAETMDSPALMTPWARSALQAALRARARALGKSIKLRPRPAPPALPRAKPATRKRSDAA